MTGRTVSHTPSAQDIYFQNFSENQNLVAGVEADLWEPGGQYPWPQAPTAVRIAAGNVADTPGGAGAHNVVVGALDENFDPVEFTLQTNGAAPGVPSAQQITRINYANVGQCGTYNGANVGPVQIEDAAGANLLGFIDTDHGETSQSMYTVPRGFKAFLIGAFLSGAGGKPVSIRMWQRCEANVVAPPVAAKRHIITLPELSGFSQFPLSAWVEFPEMTDLWFTATAEAGGNSSASAKYALLLRPIVG